MPSGTETFRPSLTLGTSSLVRRFDRATVTEVVAAAASSGFVRLDVSPEWGSLDGLAAAGLPAVVRLPPVVHWPFGQPPALEVAYPAGQVDQVLVDASASGLTLCAVVLHKWDRAWDGDQTRRWLEPLRSRCEAAGVVKLGVACVDSDPGAATAVASSLDVVSVQFNIANQRARRVQREYGKAGCAIEVRAPLDAGSLLEGFFDALGPDDVRRRYFAGHEDDARRCARLVAEEAKRSGLSPHDLAVRLVASHSWVSEICVGATSVPQLAQLAGASHAGPLTSETCDRLRGADWSWRYGPEAPADVLPAEVADSDAD